MTEQIIGVRCSGDSHVTFASFAGEPLKVGDRVLVHVDDSIRTGWVVIAPAQLVEDQGRVPEARAELDHAPVDVPSGDAARLFASLDLPDDILPPPR